jgi:hypothetical protein
MQKRQNSGFYIAPHPLQYLEKAMSEGVSPGKMLLVERLAESSGSSENINKDEWLQKSVREIMKETNQYREQTKEALKEQDKAQEQDKTKTQDKTQEQDGIQEQNKILDQENGLGQSKEKALDPNKKQEGNNVEELNQPPKETQVIDSGNGSQRQGQGSNTSPSN